MASEDRTRARRRPRNRCSCRAAGAARFRSVGRSGSINLSVRVGTSWRSSLLSSGVSAVRAGAHADSFLREAAVRWLLPLQPETVIKLLFMASALIIDEEFVRIHSSFFSIRLLLFLIQLLFLPGGLAIPAASRNHRNSLRVRTLQE